MPQCNGINNPLDGNTAAIGRDVQCSLQPLGGDIAADKQALCDVEEDELGVCAHSAAFSVQSRSGGETPRALFFLSGGGVRCASTPGDQASAAMLTQS